MQLDDVVHSSVTGERLHEATHRSSKQLKSHFSYVGFKSVTWCFVSIVFNLFLCVFVVACLALGSI